MEQRDYSFFAAQLEGFGPLMLRRLLGLYGSPENLYAQNALPVSKAQQAAFEKAKQELPDRLKKRDEWEAAGIRFVDWLDPAYPKRLDNLPDAPLGLYVKGELPPEKKACVGIVGARICSPYGRRMAGVFGTELGRKGIPVISGMARGIDGYAQEAALSAGGASYALLGCGVDICYPPGNRRLYDTLCERGGLISEYPPGSEPLPYHFPMRNRLIAAFSDLLLVLEAREKSGSFITVDQALEQGKEVLALPGRVDDELSAGCHALIRQGAGLLSGPEDIYAALGLGQEAGAARKKGKRPPKELEALWNRIGDSPKHIEALGEECGEDFAALSLQLLELEAGGFIRQVSGGCYVRA